jgi:hypothetical protein
VHSSNAGGEELDGRVASTQLGRSGKLHALNELLRTAGVFPEELTAADNDTSNFYFDTDSKADEDERFHGYISRGQYDSTSTK